MRINAVVGVIGLTVFSGISYAEEHKVLSDETINEQRQTLAGNTDGKGFGPQSPRDIDLKFGRNMRTFGEAPVSAQMNLCNIHFHKNAEHKGGEFTQYAGDGDGEGYQTGYLYSGKLTAQELKPIKGRSVCNSKHSQVFPGDTIEVHYVYSSAQVQPGATLGACISEAIKNPQLRVEAQVYVVVNDDKALNFNALTAHDVRNGHYQATDIPNNTGTPVTYAGSTTGPSYNEKASPFQVTWNVRPKVAKVDIQSVGDWCDSQNIYKEDHAHGVRNLITNPDLLSKISN
ncbi:delta-class carbonic anhydrase [Marinomonas sp.]|uniref:delta-class carbonic anhydrase n=1 Tax=Marinomonas sp. TaxID=1904862 RepID=UPI003BAAF3FF